MIRNIDMGHVSFQRYTMKRIKIGVIAFTAVLILGNARISRPATTFPLAATSSTLLHTKKILTALSDTIHPFLTGSLPELVISRLFQLVDQLPNRIDLTGRELKINKILTSLFPLFATENPIQGRANLTLSLHPQKGDTILLNVSGAVQALETSYPLPASIERAIVRCQVFLNPRTHTARGTLTCIMNNCKITVPISPKIPIAIQKITLQGTLLNRHYAFTGQALGLSSPHIQWGKYHLERIRLNSISFTPKGLLLKNLRGTMDSHPFMLTAIHYDFSPLKVEAAGSLPLDALTLPLNPALSLHDISGDIAFRVTGNFQPSVPTFRGTVQANHLNLFVGRIPLTGVYLHIRGAYEESRLALSSARLSLAPDLDLYGTLHASAGGDIRGFMKINVSHLKRIVPLLKEIRPTLFSDLNATGKLTLESHFHVGPSLARGMGALSLDGTITNIVLPINLEQVQMKLPFNLRIPLRGDQRGPGNQTLKESPGLLKIAKVEFGSLTLRNLSAHLTLANHFLRIPALTGDFFRGEIAGNAKLSLLDPLPWGIKLHLRHVSLHEICHHISGLEDAISGKVNAHLTLSGNGGKLESMHGTFSAKTFKTRDEPMRISQAFIRKLTGKKGRFLFYGRYRPYSRGRMEAVIHHGIITFKSLELSHSFLGFHDLSVSVAPTSNRIGLKELIWEILQMPGTGTMTHPVIKTQ